MGIVLFKYCKEHERDDLLRQWDQEMKDGLPPNELLNCLLEVARSMVVR